MNKNKIFTVFAATLCGTAFAYEPQLKFENDLLEKEQVFLSLDTKKVKELIDNAKETDQKVYRIEHRTMYDPNENFTKLSESKRVTFIPSGILVSSVASYRYMSFSYEKNLKNNEIHYIMTISTQNCDSKINHLSMTIFDEKGKFLINTNNSSVVAGPVCTSNPNKYEK